MSLSPANTLRLRGTVGLHVLYVTVRQTLLAAAAAATVNARSVCWRLPFTGENVILARLPKSVSVVRWPYGAIALCGRMQSNLTFATFPHLCLLLTNAKKNVGQSSLSGAYCQIVTSEVRQQISEYCSLPTVQTLLEIQLRH